MIFYSKDEFKQMQDQLNVKAMSLAQRLAEAKGFPCIRKPNNAGPSDRNDYCCGCEAALEQPAPVQEPIGYLAFRDGKPSWDEDCVCEDAVYPVDADDDRVSVAIYTAPQPDRIAQLEAANTNLFEQGQKMHKRIQEPSDSDYATIAGLDASIGHLSRLVDEQRKLLVRCADVFGVDRFGIPFEDGDSELIDRVREMVATTTSPTAIQWPKARDVGRYGDMSQEAHMRVGLDSDNDVFVSVWDGAGGATVEFCTPGAGGGKSSETRMALIALMVAMEKDNARTPRLDWWAQRMGAAVIDAAMEAK